MKKKELTAIVGVVAILIVAALAVVLLTGDDEVRQMPAINSIAELEDHVAAFDAKIIGIDAGAGIMMATEEAIEIYGLSYTLQSSSSPAMLAALDAAFNKQEAIVVTMWSPHWAVAKYNLVYLDDPEGVFGGAENITTIANTTWATNNPDAAGIGERFNWTMDDIGSVMLAIEEGSSPTVAAQAWIDDNQEAVDGWINGVTGSGTITIGLVNWECAVASSNIMKLVYEQAGYTVEMLETDAGPMYVGLSNNNADISFTAWEPLTHQSYFELYVASAGGDGSITELGVSVGGAKIGLAVPVYE